MVPRRLFGPSCLAATLIPLPAARAHQLALQNVNLPIEEQVTDLIDVITLGIPSHTRLPLKPKAAAEKGQRMTIERE